MITREATVRGNAGASHSRMHTQVIHAYRQVHTKQPLVWAKY
jgi:hypothetical protein